MFSPYHSVLNLLVASVLAVLVAAAESNSEPPTDEPPAKEIDFQWSSSRAVFYVALTSILLSNLVSLFAKTQAARTRTIISWLNVLTLHEQDVALAAKKEERQQRALVSLWASFFDIAVEAFRIFFALVASNLCVGLCNLIYFGANGYGGDNCPGEEIEPEQIVGIDPAQAGAAYAGQSCKFNSEEEEYVVGVLIAAYALAIGISYTMLHLTNRWGYEEFAEECEQVLGHFVGFRWIGIMSKQFKYGLAFLDFFTRHSIGIATFSTVYYGNSFYGLTANSEQPKPGSPENAAGTQNLWMNLWGDKGDDWKGVTAADVLRESCFMMDKALCLPNSTLAHSVTVLDANGTSCEFDSASAIPHCSIAQSITPVAPVYYYESNAHWDELGDRFKNAMFVMLIGAGALLVVSSLVRSLVRWRQKCRIPAANDELHQPLISAASIPAKDVRTVPSFGPFSTAPCSLDEIGLAVFDVNSTSGGEYSIELSKLECLDSMAPTMGRLSPAAEVTLSNDERRAAGIPIEAVFFSFAYPLKCIVGASVAKKALLEREMTDMRVSFLALGGFIYLDDQYNILGANALCQGSGLHFNGPNPVRNMKMRDTLYNANRVQEFTADRLKAIGVTGFCWLAPGEPFNSGPSSPAEATIELKGAHAHRGSGWEHGGFVFFYEDPKHDCVFCIGEAPELNEQKRDAIVPFSLVNDEALLELEEEEKRKRMEKEAVHQFRAVIADGFGMAAGLFWYACFYWLLLLVLELLDPRGSSDWTRLGEGLGRSNALGQYGPASRSLYFVAALLWCYMLELGLWFSHRVRFLLHHTQHTIDVMFHIGTVPGNFEGCLNRWLGWKKNHFHIAEIDKMNPVILTWAFGYLLFNVLRILIFNLLLDSSDQFKAWCEYGFTPATPTYPSDYKDFSNIVDTSVTSALGFCVLMHAICLPVVAYGMHECEVLKHDMMVLREMEGVVQDTTEATMHFRPMTKKEWVEQGHNPHIFDQYDTDGSGMLGKKEYYEALRTHNVFAALDADGDNKIDREEWALDPTLDPDLFDLCDHDGSGFISSKEFSAAQNAVRIFDFANDDNDGKLSKQEWLSNFQEGTYHRHKFELYDVLGDGYVDRTEFIETEIMRFEFNEISCAGTGIDEDSQIEPREWLVHRPYDVDLLEFKRYDPAGNGFVSLDEWLQAYKNERNDVKKMKKHTKFHAVVKAAVSNLQMLEQDLELDLDTQDEETKVAHHYDKLNDFGIDNLMSYSKHGQSKEEITKRRQFVQNRKEVAKKVGLNAKWRNELTDMISKASAIAIALSYEQVFEGIDVYATAQWMGDEDDCMKQLKASTLIRASVFIGCALVAVFCWKISEYMEVKIGEHEDANEGNPSSSHWIIVEDTSTGH